MTSTSALPLTLTAADISFALTHGAPSVRGVKYEDAHGNGVAYFATLVVDDATASALMRDYSLRVRPAIGTVLFSDRVGFAGPFEPDHIFAAALLP